MGNKTFPILALLQRSVNSILDKIDKITEIIHNIVQGLDYKLTNFCGCASNFGEVFLLSKMVTHWKGFVAAIIKSNNWLITHIILCLVENK